MKVLHIISSIDPQYGGPVTALAGLAEAQKSVGLDVAILAMQKAGADTSVSEQLHRRGVPVRVIGPATGPLLRHPELVAAVNEEVALCGAVHVHGLWEEIQHQAALAAQRYEKPYIVRPYGMLDPWSLAQSRFKKQLYLRWRLRRNLDQAAALHFTSQTECDLVRPLGFKASPIVESNGVNLKEFESLPVQGAFRNKYPQLGEKPLIVFLGRIHPGKGLEYLIPAFAQAQTGQAALAIVGPDSEDYRTTIENMIEAHGLQDRVFFTGILHGRDRIAALVDADLFALPSAHENFGIAVVEALAAGTPVLISDQVGIHDRITSFGVGGVVPLDVNALASELMRWMSDSELRQAAAERARPFVREQYDWQQIASRWVEHYDRLISNFPLCA